MVAKEIIMAQNQNKKSSDKATPILLGIIWGIGSMFENFIKRILK